jgi:hypothetical protein
VTIPPRARELAIEVLRRRGKLLRSGRCAKGRYERRNSATPKLRRLMPLRYTGRALAVLGLLVSRSSWEGRVALQEECLYARP